MPAFAGMTNYETVSKAGIHSFPGCQIKPALDLIQGLPRTTIRGIQNWLNSMDSG
jgi:hypothetical protein